MEMKNAEEASLVMEKEVYVAAMKGDVNFLEKTQSNEYLLRKTHEKNSILHIAIQNQRLEFIAATLRRFPQNRALICGKNSQQNSPLHIAAVVGNKNVVSQIYDDLEEIAEGDDADKPWRLKNSKGNTPAHEALVHGNVSVAMFLFCRDSQLALIVNDSKEALLHLAVKHRINYCFARGCCAVLLVVRGQQLFFWWFCGCCWCSWLLLVVRGQQTVLLVVRGCCAILLVVLLVFRGSWFVAARGCCWWLVAVLFCSARGCCSALLVMVHVEANDDGEEAENDEIDEFT